MSHPVLRSLLVIACLPVLSAEEPAKKEEQITISMTSFTDIISDAAKIAERTSLKKRNRDELSDEELGQLQLRLPTRIIKLWMDAVPILEANSKTGLKAPEVFPPGLGEAIAKVPESELAGAHLFEVLTQLKTFAEKVARPAPENPEGLKFVNVPSAWVNDFLAARQAIAMAAMEASELNGGKIAVQNRGEHGIFVELGGSGVFRKMSTADIPAIGPVYCAPFGKDGTWNLYQVINKPMTWLQAQSEVEKMALPIPLELEKGANLKAHLVSLHSPEENAFVVKIATGIAYYWIGLNDRRLEAGSDPEGPWEWSSGEPLTWKNWFRDVAGFSNEPDSGGPPNPKETFDSRTDEDGVVCAGTLEPKATGRWRDNPTGTFYSKNHRASYVVEWNLNSPKPIPGAKQ